MGGFGCAFDLWFGWFGLLSWVDLLWWLLPVWFLVSRLEVGFCNLGGWSGKLFMLGVRFVYAVLRVFVNCD